MLVLKNANIFVYGRFFKGDMLINEGTIVKIGLDLKANQEIDFTDHYILPGFLDPHVHLREPGFKNKESLEHTSKACIKGGYSTIFSLPNTDPVIDSAKSISQQKWLIEKHCQLNVHQFSSITKNMDGEELVNFDEIEGTVLGFSDGGRAIQKNKLLSNAMSNFKDRDVLFALTSDNDNSNLNRPRRSEFRHVKRNISLAKKNRVKLHLYNIAAVESLKYIKAAKKKALKYEVNKSLKLEKDKMINTAKYDISCEIPIHNLLLSTKDKVINLFTFHPEIKSESERKKLVNALRMGYIDMLTTDYQPQIETEYNTIKNYYPAGAAYIEHAFALLYTKLVKTGDIPLELLVKLLSENAYKRFGLKGGKIEEGTKANFSVFNLNESYTITKHNTIAFAKNNPFLGEEVFGVNKFVYIDGEVKLSEYDPNVINKRLNRTLLGIDLDKPGEPDIQNTKLFLEEKKPILRDKSELKKNNKEDNSKKTKKAKKIKK